MLQSAVVLQSADRCRVPRKWSKTGRPESRVAAERSVLRSAAVLQSAAMLPRPGRCRAPWCCCAAERRVPQSAVVLQSAVCCKEPWCCKAPCATKHCGAARAVKLRSAGVEERRGLKSAVVLQSAA